MVVLMSLHRRSAPRPNAARFAALTSRQLLGTPTAAGRRRCGRRATPPARSARRPTPTPATRRRSLLGASDEVPPHEHLLVEGDAADQHGSCTVAGGESDLVATGPDEGELTGHGVHPVDEHLAGDDDERVLVVDRSATSVTPPRRSNRRATCSLSRRAGERAPSNSPTTTVAWRCRGRSGAAAPRARNVTRLHGSRAVGRPITGCRATPPTGARDSPRSGRHRAPRS